MLLLLSTIPAANASECRYAKNELDLFTKQRLVTTKWDELTEWMSDDDQEPRAFVAAVTQGDQHYLAIDVRLTKTIGYEPSDAELREFMVIAGGAKLLILMMDGSIVELLAHEDVRATSRSAGMNSRSYDGAPLKIRFVIHSSAVIHYALDATASAALASQGATHVRLTTNGGDIDLKPHKRPFGDISRAVACLQTAQLPSPA